MHRPLIAAVLILFLVSIGLATPVEFKSPLIKVENKNQVSHGSPLVTGIIGSKGSLEAGSPIVYSISPSSAKQGDTVEFTVRGYNFDAGARVFLDRSGMTEINATDLVIDPPSTIAGKFNIPDSTTIGTWYVVVEVSGQESNRNIGFTLNPWYRYADSWGSYGTGDGQFNQPHGIDIDSLGYIYVTEWSGCRVQKFTKEGIFLGKWGSYGSGIGQFNAAAELAIDSSRNIYVTDFNNHRVQKFDSNGHFILTWGTYGTGNGQFNQPSGITIDSSDNVYVTDFNNHRIQKFTSSGNFITKWGEYGTGDGQLNFPAGISIDKVNNIYVTEHLNNRVQKFSETGKYILKWGTPGNGESQFNNPHQIKVDDSGMVYVTDAGNNRVQKFSSTGQFIGKWGSSGSASDEFNWPVGIVSASSGNTIYVADSNNNRIQKFVKDSATQTPTVYSITPSTAKLGSTFDYTITGKDFASNAEVSLTSSSIIKATTTLYISSTTLKGSMTIPSTASTGPWKTTVTQDTMVSPQNVQFTITPNLTAPKLQVNSPGKMLIGEEYTMRLAGTDFKNGMALKFKDANPARAWNIIGPWPLFINSVGTYAKTGTDDVIPNSSWRSAVYDVIVTNPDGQNGTRKLGLTVNSRSF